MMSLNTRLSETLTFFRCLFLWTPFLQTEEQSGLYPRFWKGSFLATPGVRIALDSWIADLISTPLPDQHRIIQAEPVTTKLDLLRHNDTLKTTKLIY